MRRFVPVFLVFFVVAACGESEPTPDGPKSRSNERGEIRRHLRGATGGAAPLAAVEPARRIPSADPATDGSTSTRGRGARARPAAASETAAVAGEGALAETGPGTGTGTGTGPGTGTGTGTGAGAGAGTGTGTGTGAVAEAGAASGADSPSALEVVRAVVARSIEGREPVGASPFDAELDRVYCFIEARNDGAAGALRVRWIEPDGTRGEPIELAVPESVRRWRTWATTRRVSGRPGAWSVVVSDAEGRELARQRFEVAAPASA